MQLQQLASRPLSVRPQRPPAAPAAAARAAPRRQLPRAGAVSDSSSSGSPGAQLVPATDAAVREALADVTVLSAADGVATPLLPLLEDAASSGTGGVVVALFLTHFADLSSWELAQKLLQKGLPKLDALGVKVVTVGLGSADNARAFAATLKYPEQRLYADQAGAAYTNLGFSPGFAPGSDVSPYLKLLTMLAGIGSPGTVQEVLRGYVGDRAAAPVFPGASPFDILGAGYQRPFELATLRLANMVGILPKWGELSPPDPNLLVQQGGCLVLKRGRVVWRHDDSGILKYTDVDALVGAVEAAVAGSPVKATQ